MILQRSTSKVLVIELPQELELVDLSFSRGIGEETAFTFHLKNRSSANLIGREALKDLLLLRPFALNSQLQKTLLLLATRENTTVFAHLLLDDIFSWEGKHLAQKKGVYGQASWRGVITTSTCSSYTGQCTKIWELSGMGVFVKTRKRQYNI